MNYKFPSVWHENPNKQYVTAITIVDINMEE
jgi:hypothetical protein